LRFIKEAVEFAARRIEELLGFLRLPILDLAFDVD
jgi:hypothetical protein